MNIMLQTFKRASLLTASLLLVLQLAIPIGVSATNNDNPPGNNGTLKVHELGTPSDTESNDPKVCVFNFEGFGFDAGQSGLIKIEPQGNDSGTTDSAQVLFGPANADGYYQTTYLNNGGDSLDNGHYKSTLYGKDTSNEYTIDLKAKSKVFKVECGAIKVNKMVDLGQGYVDDNPSSYGFLWGLDDETPTRAMGSTATKLLTGTYEVTENTVEGYEFKGWFTGNSKSCTKPSGTTLPIDVDVNKNTRHITLCNKKITTTTVPPTLTVIKNVINDDGGTAVVSDFGLEINEVELEFDVVDETDEYTTTYTSTPTVVAGTPYTLSEQDFEGYTEGTWSCSDETFSERLTITVNLSAGENLTCEITNNDNPPVVPPTLIINKVVINDNGGAKTADNFSYKINNGSTTAFETDGSNSHVVTPGTYSVVEMDDNGYTTTYDDNCTNLVLANGETKTCTITNNDIAPKLSIKKVTDADSGDKEFQFTGSNGDFGITSGGTYIASNLVAGTTFTVTEKMTDGWELNETYCNTKGGWDSITNGISVNLKAGDDITCYFENNKLGSISGFKLNDRNGNALQDDGEEKLANWTIQLWGECVEQEIEIPYLSDLRTQYTNEVENCYDMIGETTTDVNGNYSFPNLDDGTYLVCEVMQAGWTRTFPADSDCHEVIVDEGKDCIANFANKQNPGNVLGTTTTNPVTVPKVLANTGSPALQSLLIGLSILGVASGITELSRRKSYALNSR